MITIVATVIGLLSAATFAVGTYVAGVVAAILFQLAAVIDCSDGEVARLTFTESPFGAWLDIAMDNSYTWRSSVAWRSAPIGMGPAAIRPGSHSGWVSRPFSVTFSHFPGQQGAKNQNGKPMEDTIHAAWSDFMLKNVASRDFSVVVFLFAFFGKLELFLGIAAIGSMIFALVMVWVIRPSAVVTAKA